MQSAGLVERLFITILCGPISIEFVAGSSTTEGMVFLLALPQMKPQEDSDIKIHFSLFSAEFDVHVRFSTHWTGEDEISVGINLRKGEEQKQMLPDRYNSKIDTDNKNTFLFHGSDNFELTVIMAQGRKSFESLKALTVLAWNLVYYAVTAIGKPSIQIMTFKGPNHIRITLRISNPQTLAITLHGVSYSNTDHVDVTLLDLEGFSLAMCNSPDWELHGDLTGTKIVGRLPLGVISGNCKVSMQRHDCKSQGKVYNLEESNYLAEQLIPVEYYGKEFITLTTPGRISHAKVLVVTSSSDTTVRISNNSNVGANPYTHYLKKDGEYLCWISTCPEYLHSDKDISVIYFHGPRCHDEENAIKESGSPSMCLIVPCVLFYTAYHWNPFKTSYVTPKDYFLVVIRLKYLSHLLLNGKRNSSKVEDSVNIKGSQEWKLVFLTLSADMNHVQIKSESSAFGCYVLQLTEKVTAMHPANYIVHPYVLKCTPTHGVVPGDLVDNDCDGEIDEESLDGNDDDDDGKTDEDVNSKSGVTLFPRGTTAFHSGKWTEWGPWQCTRDCEELREARHRKCSDEQKVCPGVGQEMRESECYFGKKCPDECLFPKWGPNCIHKCINCYKDCDKFTGACLACKDGFKLLDGFCNSECDRKTYGRRCNQSCTEKCAGEDCIDRVTGECPSSTEETTYSLLALLFLIPLCLTVCLCDIKRRNEKKKKKKLAARKEFLDSMGSDVSKKSSKSVKSMKSERSMKSRKSIKSGWSERSGKSGKSTNSMHFEYAKRSKKSVASAVDPDSEGESSDEDRSNESSGNSS